MKACEIWFAMDPAFGLEIAGMSWGYHNSGPPAGTEEDYIHVRPGRPGCR